MDWLPAVGLALYYIGYYVSLPILFLVKWVLYILYIIVAPFIYTVNTLKEVMLLPFRFLARFEAILYFILSAALLGAALGAVLHFVFRAVVVVFDLNRKPVPKSIPPKGHSVASYREAREAKKQKELERQQRFATQARLMASGPLLQDRVREARQQSSMAGIAPASPGTSRPALLQQTILEHTDEEDDDSVF